MRCSERIRTLSSSACALLGSCVYPKLAGARSAGSVVAAAAHRLLLHCKAEIHESLSYVQRQQLQLLAGQSREVGRSASGRAQNPFDRFGEVAR